MPRYSILAGALALALASCGEPADPPAAPEAEETPGAAPAAPASPLPAAGEGPSFSAAAIPAAFHGKWDLPDAPCDPVTDGRLEIAASEVNFYESHGAVTRVTIAGPTQIDVAADMSGEGENWAAGFRFELKDGGKTLVTSDLEEPTLPPLARKRCT